MSKPVPTAKEINEAHKIAETSAKHAVEHAILCGQLLLKKKADMDHGKFEAWCEQWVTIPRPTVKLYMKAAREGAHELKSLRHLFPSGTKPKNAKRVTGQMSNALDICNEIPAELPSNAVQHEPPKADSGHPKSIEVTPAPDYDFTDYEPEDDEEYRRNIDAVMMADDKLSAMREELKKVRVELQAVVSSRDHYQNEAGAAVRLVKARDREIERLQSDKKKLQAELEKLRERIAVMQE